MRLTSRIAIVAVTAAFTSAVGVSTASASPTANWAPVSTNSNWHCTGYTEVLFSPGMKLKSCIVRNANQDAQGVLVIQNTSGRAYEINNVDERSRVWFESEHGGDVWCASSTINSGATRGCFGKTVHVGCRATTKADVLLALRDPSDGFKTSTSMEKGGVPSGC
ncbi:hypothetical protein [Streptomyces sp. ODS05-4]|uniref:hypothetical protein n=1 Tax=Streptomyces sp. ODS05-4 TaxID=2944939 RepID=UPI00210A3158|nr:hypothetical protein [Streptomyces sp. ODS05-4]